MKFLLCTFSLFLCLTMSAQPGAPNVPTEFELVDTADYDKYHALAEKSMIWLLQNPLDEYQTKRDELNAFALLWLTGSPEIYIDVKSAAIPCLKDHQDLFPVFACGAGLYSMQHPREKDNLTLHTEGLRAIARMVKQTKSLKRERCFKPLKKACRKGELREYASALMNPEGAASLK